MGLAILTRESRVRARTGSMKSLLLFIFLFLNSLAMANEVKIETNPPRPVAGEVFQAYFRIFTDSDEEPAITFSPSNLEVVGKSNQGVSTRTVYANGKLSVTREMTVVYELVAAKPGNAYMRDINVQLGSKNIKHQSLTFTVLKEAEELADVFVMADVPKKTLFLGEGVVVRYFLYSKVPVSNLDIKRYPKLNNFLKRFLQEAERSERVSVDGQLYMRTQIYAAKLYAEKIGEQKIDSLNLSATYPTSRAGDPFGAFGLSRDFKTKTLNSEVVKVQVKPLPEPAPAHFTGLVGPHDFQIQFGQSKLIVNEPMEVKLTVSGVGALENLEAPKFIEHPGLEEFESNGDLKISDSDHATKVFDYTFLAKENLQIPAKEITLSYFDPNSERYVATQLKVPEIIVAGGQAGQNKKEDKPKEDQKSPTNEPKSIPSIKELTGPMTIEEWQWKQWLPFMNLFLAGFAVLVSLGWMIKQKKFTGVNLKSDVPSAFKKGQFELGDFVKWLTPLIKTTGKSPIMIIKDSPLPEESKRYFIDLLTANDYKDYSARKSQMDFKYQSGHFKELGRYIESVRNEDSSQPS
jgi:hypothetical protein